MLYCLSLLNNWSTLDKLIRVTLERGHSEQCSVSLGREAARWAWHWTNAPFLCAAGGCGLRSPPPIHPQCLRLYPAPALLFAWDLTTPSHTVQVLQMFLQTFGACAPANRDKRAAGEYPRWRKSDLHATAESALRMHSSIFFSIVLYLWTIYDQNLKKEISNRFT